MSTNLAASPHAYRESAILTAPPERLVVMLYDGARRFLHQAAVAMRGRDVPASHERLRRAEAIVDHLRVTLDMEQGGEVAARLEAIYDFCTRQLAEARMRQEPELLDQVGELLGELRDAWAQIAQSPVVVAPVEAARA
jgi:flagellar secretion chaperone FliS